MPAPSRPPPAAPATPSSRWSTVFFWALIFVAVAAAYSPALHGTLLWDDSGHVTRPDLRSLAGLGRIWVEWGATQQYYPVLHSAFWLEHRLWGDAVLGYHLLNVLLHATAAGLFALVLRRLAVPGAWFAALLFALHPVCVESVAWISEQKNTLSLVFYLAAALCYLRFNADRSWRTYLAATGLFLLALLTKTVTATLPAALLVVFWWKRGRLDLRREVLPLLPWLALGAVSGLITAHFERVVIGAEGSDFNLSLVQRFLLAGHVFWFYLGKLAWPADLIFIYPHWTIDPARLGQWLFPAAALLLVGVLLWRKQRSLLAAALLFGGALFPVLGFFNVYPFLFSYVADHFQYLASLPIYALVAVGAVKVAGRLPGWTRQLVAGTLLATLGLLTWSQAAMYRDAATLYRVTLQRNPDCWMAHNNLAILLAADGQVSDAIPHLEAALTLKPDFAQAENNLGDDLVRLGRPTEAIPHFEHAVQLQPTYAVAHRNLGMALAMTGHVGEALPHFERAAQIDSTDAEAELDWAMALDQTGQFSAAVPHFERAIALNPHSSDAQLAYGQVLAAHRDFDGAVVHYRAALTLAPNSADAHRSLASALRQLGRTDEARTEFLTAQRLGGGR